MDYTPIFMPDRVDIHALTYGSHRIKTTLSLLNDESRYIPWITLGEVCILRLDGRDEWILSAEAANDPSIDETHEVIKVISLKLGCVTFKNMMHHGCVYLVGTICAEDPNDFRVPTPGYNPLLQGGHLPPKNPELFEKLKGRKVEISIRTLSWDPV